MSVDLEPRLRSSGYCQQGITMTGQCFCGSVAFEFEGPTTDIQLCHCKRCQRATGAPFAAEFKGASRSVSLAAGRKANFILGRADTPRTTAYRQSFCKIWGSPVPSVFAGDPGVQIPTGLVDGDLPARASEHIWVSKKANWLNLVEIATLPQYDCDPPAR